MLLKSSSTPVLGSLLSSSFTDNPNRKSQTYSRDANSIKHHAKATIPLFQTGRPFNISSTFSCNSSPISSSIAGKGIRRAQSEGNLEGLVYGPCSNIVDFHDSSQLSVKKFTRRPSKRLMLQTIPSLSLYDSRDIYEDEEEKEEEEEEQLLDYLDDNYDEDAEEQEKICQEICNRQTVVLTPERVIDRGWDAGVEQERGVVSCHQEMFLTTGDALGGDNSGSGGGGNSGRGGQFNSRDRDGRDRDGAEEYYKRMVDENPGNPLFLRNYAQFLYQNKADLQGAEEYYSRAILADPGDGEIMSRYAQLLWKLHHDQDRALSYFERAVQVSPEDSHVQAAYANFLWEMEEDEDGCNAGTMTTASPNCL